MHSDPSFSSSDAPDLAVFEDVFQALDIGLVLWDSNMNFVISNDQHREMHHHDNPPPEAGDNIVDVMHRLLETGFYKIPPGWTNEQFTLGCVSVMKEYTKNIIMKTADGRIFNSSIHKTALGGYLNAFTDITERHLAKIELDRQRAKTEEVNAQFNEALEALDDGIALWDSDLRFLIANQRFLDMLYPDATVRPEPGDHFQTLIERQAQAGIYAFPEGASHEDVSSTWIAMTKTYHKGLDLELADGRSLEASSHKTSVDGYLHTFKDVTDQRRAEAELERQRELVHQNEKLSALGELLAGVAHELNNPLSIIVGYSQMLEGTFEDPTSSKRITRINQAADRCAKIVKTFLAMARQRPTIIEQCSLNEIVIAALDVAGYGLRANGTQVELELDESLPLISGDADQLVQVFTNLIVNAEHALADKMQDGILVLRSYYDQETDHSIVEVRDNGQGIPTSVQSRIFDPFFTTKDVGTGTGIGLAFSHRIIDTHGGLLELRSKAGKGTSFFVQLRAVKDIPVDERSNEAPIQASQTCRVLVVDDEDAVAELICDILEENGHTVATSADAREALKLMQSNRFDVILSDFKMPGLDGDGFFRIIQDQMPEYAGRVGFVTGDTMSAKIADFFNETRRPYIEKPISAAELIGLVDKLA